MCDLLCHDFYAGRRYTRQHVVLVRHYRLRTAEEDLLTLGNEEISSSHNRGEKRKHVGEASTSEDDRGSSHVDRENSEELSYNIDSLMAIMNGTTSVVKILKDTYEESLLTDSDTDNNDVTTTTTKQPLFAGNTNEATTSSVIATLAVEVTGEEETWPAISGKIATALDGILTNGVNDKILAKRKEGLARPENYN